MSHRVNNNVGYKPIFPMSNGQDDTLCHYCGRKASLTIRLEWDHVPALNVQIPSDQRDLYSKTLVRSCQECNGLASDIPHLDYLERHFWLKAAYLRRYKRLLLSVGPKDIDTKNMTGYLRAAVENYDFMYKDILMAIGFGIKNIDYIESPILKLKNIDGKVLEDVLLGFLYGEPFTDEGEDESDIDEVEEDIDYCSFPRFVEFLLSYKENGIELTNQLQYESWINENSYFFEINELPKKPAKNYQISWENICQIVEIVISHTKRKHKITDYFIDDLKNEFASSEVSEYCSFEQFVEVIASEQINLENEDNYLKWFKVNFRRAKRLSLPNEPAIFYSKSWDTIYLEIIKVKDLINDLEDSFDDELTIEFQNKKVEEKAQIHTQAPKKVSLAGANNHEIDLFKKVLKDNFKIIESRASRQGTFWYKSFSYDIKKIADNDYIFSVYSARYDYQEFIAKVAKLL